MAEHRMLNVVDEKGNVVGTETRETIHREGLLHREVHVWLYTPRGEAIFQRRGKNADTHPNLLDASVGGHVEAGADFLDTAVKELAEETGLAVVPEDLTLVRMVRANAHDPATGTVNNVLRAVYAYRYAGRIADLRVEEGRAQGFETWPISGVREATADERRRFVPSIFTPEVLGILRDLQRRAARVLTPRGGPRGASPRRR